MNNKHILLAVAVCQLGSYVHGQNTPKEKSSEESLIAASQGSASSLFFNPGGDNVPVIAPGSFYLENECAVRNGMGNFFTKLDKGQPVTVAYIGGSITQGYYCYRMQSAKYIQLQYPQSKIKWINAGVAGTGTDLAACRIESQVLKYKPDLIFIEFAVNGAYMSGMEGMVRQIWKNNPLTDICFIYTIQSGQTKIYTDGAIPENIQGLEKIAAHYKIPSIHLGMEAAALEKSDSLVWKGNLRNDKDKIIFSTDGIHPVMAGGNLYAAAIARGLIKMKEVKKSRHSIPAPLLADNWQDAGMYNPDEVAVFSKGFTKLSTKDSLNKFAAWFPYLMSSDQPGESFTFRFTGTMFGFFDIGGPEVGQLEIIVDDKPMRLKDISPKGARLLQAGNHGEAALNLFNPFCNNRYRGQFDFIELSPGTHTVKVVLSGMMADKKTILGPKQSEDITVHPEKYNRTVVYLGKLLLRGKIKK